MSPDEQADEAFRRGWYAGVAEAERLALLRAAHTRASYRRELEARERAAYAAGQAAGAGAAP